MPNITPNSFISGRILMASSILNHLSTVLNEMTKCKIGQHCNIELYKLSIGPQRPRLSCCAVEKTRNLTESTLKYLPNTNFTNLSP